MGRGDDDDDVYRSEGFHESDDCEDDGRGAKVYTTPPDDSMPPEKKEAKRAKLTKAFAAFDKDNSGSIDKDELKAILTRKGAACEGLTFSDEDAEELLESFDTNGDGVLQLTEFIELMLSFDDDGEET